MGLAIGVAEIAEVFAALVAAELAFLAFVFGEFFFRVGIGFAGCKHRIGARGLAFLLAEPAEFVADLAERSINCFDFDQQVADFFQKIVEVVGANNVGEFRLFELTDELAAGHFGDEEKAAEAAAVFDRNSANFAKHEKPRGIEPQEIGIGNDEGPYADAELG